MIFHIHFSSIKLLITQRGQVHGLYLKFSDDGPFNKNYSPNDGAKSMDFSQSLLMMDSLIKLFTQGWGKVHGLYPAVFRWWTSQLALQAASSCTQTWCYNWPTTVSKPRVLHQQRAAHWTLKRLHKEKNSPNCDLTGYHGRVCKRFEQCVQVHLDIMLSERGLYFRIQRHNQS